MSPSPKNRARAVADLSQGTILAAVEIDAPPERVFRALASSEIVQWWGGEGDYRTTEWTGDARVGGRFRAMGIGAGGTSFSVEGDYLEVDPPRTLAHSWRPSWEPGESTTVTFRFEPTASGTRVTLWHKGFVSRASCTGHAEGWAQVFEWLQGYVAPPAAPDPVKYFFIRLLPPRPTFRLDMTEDERRMMLEHVGYWRGLLRDGIAVVFGPVDDPQGSWGLGVVEVREAAKIREIESKDPAIRSGRGFRYEVLPLVRAVSRSP